MQMRKSKSLCLEEIEKAILPCLRQNNVQKAIVFGSYARQSHSSRSDLDLVLVMKTSKPFFQRYEGILNHLYEAITGIDIDLLIYTPDEFDSMRDRKFIQAVMKDGVCIYES